MYVHGTVLTILLVIRFGIDLTQKCVGLINPIKGEALTRKYVGLRKPIEGEAPTQKYVGLIKPIEGEALALSLLSALSTLHVSV